MENFMLNLVRRTSENVEGLSWRFFTFTADINAIAKIYGKQIVKNNEAYMTIDKMVVDFVMKGARFRVKDQGHQQLSNY